MAFSRDVQLNIGSNGTGLAFNQLDIDFRVEKTNTLSNNFAEFTIYNAKESTRQKVLKKGNNLIFSCGYKDEAVANMFVGNIIQVQSYQDRTNWVSKIKASTVRAKDDKLQLVTVTLSYAPGTPLSQPVTDIVNASGLAINGISNITSLNLPNGWVYVGTYGGALRYIKDILATNNIGFYIDNNEVVIYKLGESSRYKVVFLTYTGGLLSIKNITKAEEKVKRIQFESLIIPQIRVNGLVTVKGTPTDDGSYIVDKFVAEGNNYGGDYKLTGEGVV